MRTWHMIIDVEKCEDCNNCFLTCKDEHVDNDWPGYTASQPLHGHRWMNIMRKERGRFPLIDVAYLPIPCMHCAEAPCIKAAKEGAIYRREEGIVLIDPEKSKGQKAVIKACPYGAIFWNEEKNIPQKCTFCAHLMDEGWKEPRCVQACPTGALYIADVDEAEMNALIDSEKLVSLKPELKTSPRVYYKNLHRYEACFIAGSVAHKKNGSDECGAGAKVCLFKDNEKVDEMHADAFGDFKFDNLDENSGNYVIEIDYENNERKKVNVELTTSQNMGTIWL